MSGTGSHPEATAPAGPPRAPGSARVMMGSTMLILEVFVVLFGALTMFGLRLVDPGPLVLGAVIVSALCIVAVARLRTTLGWVLGTLAQIALLASSFVLPAMAIAGVVFAALFLTAYLVGGRIDVERKERHAAEIEYWRARQATSDAV